MKRQGANQTRFPLATAINPNLFRHIQFAPRRSRFRCRIGPRLHIQRIGLRPHRRAVPVPPELPGPLVRGLRTRLLQNTVGAPRRILRSVPVQRTCQRMRRQHRRLLGEFSIWASMFELVKCWIDRAAATTRGEITANCAKSGITAARSREPPWIV